MKIGYFRSELKNQIMLRIINNVNIVKALVVDKEDFLNETPTAEQLAIINNPELLIRTQLFPHKKVTVKMNRDKTFLTMSFRDFEKKGVQYQHGMIYFHILVPNEYESTNEGSRYDYIMEKLEEIFGDRGIGKFEFFSSSDIDIDDNYMGAFVAFEILDFYGW